MTDKEQRAPPREPAPVSSRARPGSANSDAGSDIDTSAQRAPSIRTPIHNRPSERKADSDINSDVESAGKPPTRVQQGDNRSNMEKQVLEDEEEIPGRRASGSAAGVRRRASSLTGSRQSIDGARDSTNDFNMPRSSEAGSRDIAGEQLDVLDRDSFDDVPRSKDSVGPAARRSGDVDDVKVTSLESTPIQAGPRVASGDAGVRKSVPRQQSDSARSVGQGRQSSAGDEDYEDERLSERRMASDRQGQGVRRSQSNKLQQSGKDDKRVNDGDGRVRDRKAAASKLADEAGNSVRSTDREDDSEGPISLRAGVRQSQQAGRSEQQFQEESFDMDDEGPASSIENVNSEEDVEDEDGFNGKTSSARRSQEPSSRPSNPRSADSQNRESRDAARRSQSKGVVEDAGYIDDGHTPEHQQSRAGKPPRTRQVPSETNEYNDEVPSRRNKNTVRENSRVKDAEYSSDHEEGFPNTLGSRSLDGASQSDKARSAAHAGTREDADEAEEADSPIKGSRDRKGRLKPNVADAGSTYRPAGIPNDQGPETNRANLLEAAPAMDDYGLDEKPPSRARTSKRKDGQERKQRPQQQQEQEGYAEHGRDEAPLVPDLERAFQGDVSHWGRTDMPEFYDDEEADGSQANMSIATMSSGLSPRDTRPRLQPFDYDKATKALQYQSGLYARAQTMRRDGTAPAVAGITDDLPTRIAYQQLNMLAGMAGKVQDAILHNKKVFEHRMVMEDRAGLKRAFQAWRAARYGSIAKQNKLRKACARISKGMLSRAFYTWKDKFPLCDNSNLMKRKVAAIVARGMRRRCFLEWKRLCEDRWWKTQNDMRDRQISLLENKIRGYERRPILVLRKRRLKEMLKLWKGQVDYWSKKKKRLDKACRHFKNMQYTKAWHSWMDVLHESRRQRGLLRKAVLRINNIAISSSWNKWRSQAETRKQNNGKLKKAVLLWMHTSLSKAWSTWLEYLEWKKQKRQIMQRWMNPQKARALAGWYEQTQWKMRMKLILNRTAQRLSRAALAVPFYTWLEETQSSVTSKTIEGGKQTMLTYETELKQLRAENERLQRDNERFVRLIDSGEWGRGRVAELVQAGEVLKGERDALFKLISSLRQEYDSVQQAKAAQDDELQKMKEKMLLGGHARNRMLIKGGSSFNALVRAMKQDLVEARHNVQKDPNLLYEIDKLSMDHVQVFPDGELNVQAVTTAPNAAAFSRPVSTGRHRSSTGSTAKFRSPTALQSMVGHSGPSSSLPSSPTKLSRSTKGGSSGVGGPETITSVLTALKGLTPAEQDQLKALLQQHKDSGQVPGSPSAQQARARAT